MSKYSFKSTITGLKCTNFPSYLRDVAFLNNLKLEIDVEKHWIRETTRFKLIGDKDVLEKVIKEIYRDIKNFNNE